MCKDVVDTAILNQLYQAGHKGLYPVIIDERLSEYSLSRSLVSHRIQRMNKTLKKELDQIVAEKRGWHRALTKAVYEIWGATKEEIEESSS